MKDAFPNLNFGGEDSEEFGNREISEYDLEQARVISAKAACIANNCCKIMATQEYKYKPGKICTVNQDGDLWLIAEAKPFIDKVCVIVKRTKAGLIQVALLNDQRKTFSVGQKNITLQVTI